MQLAAAIPARPLVPTARIDSAPAKVDSAPAKVDSAPAEVDDQPLVPVPVSDTPPERLEQLIGFFHRNPGWMKTGPVADAMRSALDRVPKVGEAVRDLTEPADVGYGQAIRDQTKWQIDTKRQPENDWWMRMNRQLVEDPLTAERAVRTGTVDKLETAGQKAWAEYIRRSDKIYEAMGLSPEDVATAAKEGRPVALSDAWKGVGLLKRAYVQLVLKPYARKAIWVAHRKTLEDGRPQAMKQAETMHRKAPKEMSFSSSWATIIGYWSYLSPPVTGNQSKIAQKFILPEATTLDEEQLDWSERAFAKVADWLDPLYERDIAKPTDAKDAAAAKAGKSDG